MDRFQFIYHRQNYERYSEQKLVLLAHVLKPDNVDDRKLVNEL